jgi:hypothetical protein
MASQALFQLAAPWTPDPYTARGMSTSWWREHHSAVQRDSGFSQAFRAKGPGLGSSGSTRPLVREAADEGCEGEPNGRRLGEGGRLDTGAGTGSCCGTIVLAHDVDGH